MKHKLLGSLIVLTVGALAQSAFAQASGVRCPAGYDDEYSAGTLKCAKVAKVYVYPSGHDFGNASTPQNGVRCQADSNDRYTFQAGVLKCIDVKRETVKAYCTIGWELKTNQGQDACRSVVGNMDPTLPDGQISRQGWDLLTDHEGNKDFWRRTTTRFEYPVPR